MIDSYMGLYKRGSMSFNSELGKNIRLHRKKAGLKLAEVEKLSGIKVAMLSRYEKGESSISVECLQKIATALGVSSAFLLFSVEKADVDNCGCEANLLQWSFPLRHMYYYDGRVGRIVSSRIDIIPSEVADGEASAMLYYGVSGADRNVAGQIYFGRVDVREGMCFFVLDNPKCSVDRLTISVAKPVFLERPTVGVVSGISTVHQFAPMAFTAVFSTREMDEGELMQFLKLSKNELSHIKANNMLMPYKTLI